jgi:hypothetical protein
MERIIGNGWSLVGRAETGSLEPTGFEIAPLRRGFFVTPNAHKTRSGYQLQMMRAPFKIPPTSMMH